jgi:hypothetical protein
MKIGHAIEHALAESAFIVKIELQRHLNHC